MSNHKGHNIGFYKDLTKIIIKYHQICTLSLLLIQKRCIFCYNQDIVLIMILRKVNCGSR